MEPNLTRMQQVLDRIDEIVQKCNPHIEKAPHSQSAQNRFVELLENEEKNNEASAVARRANAAASMDDIRRKILSAADRYNIDE